MDKRLLERIIIIILLLVNLFLLLIVLSDKLETRRNEAEMLRAAETLLENSGIAAADKVFAVQSAPPACAVRRDAAAETEKVTSLLGSHSQQDLGGNILFYRSDKGQAVFRGTGEVDILFSGNEVAVRGSREKTVERLMQRVGAEVLLREGTKDEMRVECFCCWNGYPVFNAVLNFDFNDRSLYMVGGTRTFDIETESSDDALLNSVSVLTRFAEMVQAQDFACTRLESLQPGYLMNVSVSGESVLTPVWYLQTDGGALLINAETGRMENTAALKGVSP
ncbi:MAG: hypothetical protein E7472_06655 [Ruminococcaceae bacterium]|nr:hypothetical protein [Oscillospiraceae bacterium]